MLNKILTILAYLAMITINFLANYLPLNNRSTGDISDAYPNLFAPAGYTFSIWGVIYALLLCYLIFQFVNKQEIIQALIKKINPFFIATSLTNFAWIFAWHYDYIGLSVVLMLILLVLLIIISNILLKQHLQSWNKFFLAIPFHVYFGWITVATIANITVFLVSLNWNGFGISDSIWMIIVLLIGAMIGVAQIIKSRSMAYGIVIIWAYAGILYKHLSASGFNYKYPEIIITTISIILISFFTARAYSMDRKRS